MKPYSQQHLDELTPFRIKIQKKKIETTGRQEGGRFLPQT